MNMEFCVIHGVLHGRAVTGSDWEVVPDETILDMADSWQAIQIAADICPTCQGRCKIMECAEWNRTGGNCCPDGTIRDGCLGKTIQCPDCGEING